jgi:hypothetical protein
VPDVVAHERRAAAARVGGDHEVHGAERLAALLELGADVAVVLGRGLVPRQDGEARDEVADLAPDRGAGRVPRGAEQ